uniref:Angiopoietin-related protein 1-like n=1 Tax=Saccoglossus kowalevskii TaxID=10224 RepID=A0ABM0MCI4_SACKO|nr:PREDICTED: angiopoietin-related protein 1-like [Saccoglossus kowalevskii]
MSVWCDMETDGGGWTVFQRRFDGSEDFYRNWTEYKNGFGDVDKEHWLGNDNINRFTKSGKFKLRIDLDDWRGETRYATYDVFRVDDEADKYYLRVGGYSGNAGDSMVYHHGAEFSTYDVDNDGSAAENAAQRWKGGWWYRRGWNANPNGLYYQNGVYSSKDEWTDGVVWDKWQSWWYSLKATKLMIKRQD